MFIDIKKAFNEMYHSIHKYIKLNFVKSMVKTSFVKLRTNCALMT